MEQDRVARAVQQSQQGKWTTWEDVMQMHNAKSGLKNVQKSRYPRRNSKMLPIERNTEKCGNIMSLNWFNSVNV